MLYFNPDPCTDPYNIWIASKMLALQEIYDSYSAASSGGTVGRYGIDGTRFLRFCKDVQIFHPTLFKREDVDVVFAKFKEPGCNFLSFRGFRDTITNIATKLQVPNENLIRHIIEISPKASKSTSSTVTVPLPTRFHDDINLYTGVHKCKGPTVVDYKDLSAIVNRSLKSRSEERLSTRRAPSQRQRHKIDEFHQAEPSPYMGLYTIAPAASQDPLDSQSSHRQQLAAPSSVHSFDEYQPSIHRCRLHQSHDEAALSTQFASLDLSHRAPLAENLLPLPLPPSAPTNSFQTTSSSNASPTNHTMSPHEELYSPAASPPPQPPLPPASSSSSPPSFLYGDTDHQRELQAIFEEYIFGNQLGIDGARFLKFCKDFQLFDHSFRQVDVDVVFVKHKEAGQRYLSLRGFYAALHQIASRRRLSAAVLLDYVARHRHLARRVHAVTSPTGGGGGGGAALVPPPNRFHDDVAGYTGVHKWLGGPTVVDSDHVKDLQRMVDRSLPSNNGVTRKQTLTQQTRKQHPTT